MSTQAIISAIYADGKDDPVRIEAILQFALAEAMLELDKPTRLRVVEQVKREIEARKRLKPINGLPTA